MKSVARKRDHSPTTSGPTFPREADDFHDAYKRWSPRIFAFCLLVSGDADKAESLTEQTFALYFGFADSLALHDCSHLPVALLRFASDLAEIQCGQQWGACSGGLSQALLSLPFRERAVIILVSVLRVQPSAAAVALRLRRRQLADHWTRAALRLRRSWLEPQRRTARSAAGRAISMFLQGPPTATAETRLRQSGGLCE